MGESIVASKTMVVVVLVVFENSFTPSVISILLHRGHVLDDGHWMLRRSSRK